MDSYINITPENLKKEHLCCAISDKKHQQGVQCKKDWIKERMKEGHVFRKLEANAKVFIEYAPLEKAWTPVDGTDYIYIYCLWVAGSYKGKGYGKQLIEYVIEDARKQNKKGICTVTSKKKKPYLSEKKFFEKYGFQVVDSIGEYELLSLNFEEESPKFRDNARQMHIPSEKLTIYYSAQCPFTMNCIKELKKWKEEKQKDIVLIEVDSLEKAKNVPCIFQNWANFKEGKFVSNTLLNVNMIEKLYQS